EAELGAVAEWRGGPVPSTVSGQGSLAEKHPPAVGVVGSNGGTMPTRAIVEAADLVVFVGCRAGSVTTERWRFLPLGKVKIIHLDADPAVIGASYPTDVAIISHACLALTQLRRVLAEQPRPAIVRELNAGRVAQAKEEKFAAFAALARSDKRPIRPERVVADMQGVLPEDSVIVADPGTPCPYFSAYYQLARA